MEHIVNNPACDWYFISHATVVPAHNNVICYSTTSGFSPKASVSPTRFLAPSQYAEIKGRTTRFQIQTKSPPTTSRIRPIKVSISSSERVWYNRLYYQTLLAYLIIWIFLIYNNVPLWSCATVKKLLQWVWPWKAFLNRGHWALTSANVAQWICLGCWSPRVKNLRIRVSNWNGTSQRKGKSYFMPDPTFEVWQQP